MDLRAQPDAPVIMTTSSRMLIERMLHNSASVMMRQREDEGIADYTLFTHEEVDRCAKRLTGLPFGHAKHFRGAKDEIEVIFHPAGHVAGAAAVDYLMYSGYVCLAYFWARMAVLARHKIAAADGDVSFYQAKLMTARFYFDRLLPRTLGHKNMMLSGADNLMEMPVELFEF